MKISTEKSDYFVRMENSDTGFIIFSYDKSNFPIDIPIGKYVVKHVNPYTGDIKIINKNLKGGVIINFEAEAGVYYFEKR
jgi:hypothetical protein